MNRQEHLAWSRERALALLNQGERLEAITSMLSDLLKHSGTARAAIGHSHMLRILGDTVKTDQFVRAWIEGFR